MLHARSLGGFRGRFITHRDLRANIDEQEYVDSIQRSCQFSGIAEITDEDIDTIAETGVCLCGVANKDAGPLVALD
jgi:hypothetical protein